jgi:hypothetical protein
MFRRSLFLLVLVLVLVTAGSGDRTTTRATGRPVPRADLASVLDAVREAPATFPPSRGSPR